MQAHAESVGLLEEYSVDVTSDVCEMRRVRKSHLFGVVSGDSLASSVQHEGMCHCWVTVLDLMQTVLLVSRAHTSCRMGTPGMHWMKRFISTM